MSDGELLPWERPDGDPVGTGICLSGGGLRAASFGLGALQALQEDRGLLYGPRAADHLAVVSGGSYIAASAMLSAPHSTPEMPPVATGAPEASHITGHARYLIEDGRLRTGWRFGWRIVVASAASALLLTWTGFILADLAVILAEAHDGLDVTGPDGWFAYLLAIACVAALGASGTSEGPRQYALVVVGLGGVVIAAPGMLGQIERTEWLDRPAWWLEHGAVAGGVVVVYAIGSAAPYVRQSTATVANCVTQTLLRLVFVALNCWAIAAIAPHLRSVLNGEDVGLSSALLLVVSLVGGLWASYVHDVVSLHRPYRDLAARCFGVRRRGSEVDVVTPPTAASVSDLAPPSDPQRRHPRLLVCATANLRGRRGACAPFVISHDRTGLAGVEDASFATGKLELGRARASILGRKVEPELSLMSAVAMTGAAIAPTMGSMTVVGARPFLVLLNLRLGVWLPNPLSPARRDVVDMRPRRPSRLSARRDEHGKLGPGASAVVAELLGAHSSNARRIYVTDGGHYDNLGLLALLRARCAEIWSVDVYNKRTRLARQLDTVIALAREELGVVIELDTSMFELASGATQVAKNCWAQGLIRYPDSSVPGRLTVVKLALTSTTPQDVAAYRSRDRRFPYHSTMAQWYGSERFEQYRALGHHNAMVASCAAGPA